MKTPLLVLGALCALGFVQKPQVPLSELESDVYRGSIHIQRVGNRDYRQLYMNGQTLDLAQLEVSTYTLKAGEANQPLQAVEDAEELVVVKQGSLTATLRDSTKTLGAGGVMLINAGDKQRLQNTGTTPATYYVLRFKSKDGVDRQRAQAGGGSFMQDWSKFKVVKTDKGETRPVFDRPSSVFKRFDVHATVLNPGRASHPPHTHRAEEIILMTKGSGEMLIADKPHKAATGDVILVRANVPHAFTNTGKEPCGYFAIQWHSNAEK